MTSVVDITRGHRIPTAAISLMAVFAVYGAWNQAPAQTPPAATAKAASDAPDLGMPIKVTVNNLVAPVLVTDRNGNIVDGLQPSQFHLYDNGVEQNIHVDAAYQPISLVVAIEKSTRVEGIIPKIHKLGILLTQITGRDGEAAIIAFDNRISTVQDFTTDNDKIKVAIDSIQSLNSGTRVIDAAEQGIHMLSKRPASSRRVLMLVSETRTTGDQASLKETLIDAQLANVLVYSVDISQLAVRLNEKQDEPRPSAMDITAMDLPMGVPSTPTTMEQNFGMGNRAQFVPLLKEIFIDAKGLFVRDPSTQFARATGGSQFVFTRQKGLEDAVERISQEVHSQYLVSYKPSNGGEGGYHTIVVTIDRQPDDICKTRPGYWIGGGAQ